MDTFWHNWLHYRTAFDNTLVLAGPYGVGKTFLALDIVRRLVRGLPLPGATNPVESAFDRILWVDPIPGVTSHRIAMLELQDHVHVWEINAVFDLSTPHHLNDLYRKIHDVRPRLVVLDPLDAFHTGSYKKRHAVVRQLHRLDVPTLVVHGVDVVRPALLRRWNVYDVLTLEERREGLLLKSVWRDHFYLKVDINFRGDIPAIAYR